MPGKKSAIYGEVTAPNGNANPLQVLEPLVVSRDIGGYAPETLDPVLEKLVRNADSGAALLEKYTPLLGELMSQLQDAIGATISGMREAHDAAVAAGETPPPVVQDLAFHLKLAGQVSIILDRMQKMTTNAVKSKDDATRLRSFLATGNDNAHRTGLDNLSESQLRRMVAQAASGWTKNDEEPVQ